MYHANVNVNMMVENVIHIRKGITINVDMSKRDYIWNPAIYSCEMVNI